MAPYRLAADGIVLEVRLTPGASRDGIDGVKVLSDGQAVAAARVRAVPDAGAANRELCVLLAEIFHVPKASVSMIAGTWMEASLGFKGAVFPINVLGHTFPCYIALAALVLNILISAILTAVFPRGAANRDLDETQAADYV